jgi:surface antigen
MRGKRWQRRLAPRQAWLAGALALAAATTPIASAQEGTMRPAVAAPSASDARGAPRPLREFSDADGRPCRVYARDVIIDGRLQPALAVVCREASGRWVLSR